MFNLAMTSPVSSVSSGTDKEIPFHKCVAVNSPPEDAISCIKFSPPTQQSNLLVAGSWDNSVRCWQMESSAVLKGKQSHDGPVLDVSWHDDGTKVFTASCDKTAKMWDLGSNQIIQVAAHDAPIKTCDWIKGSNYSCLMTGSWDKTLKFWDTRSPNPMATIQLTERAYAADVMYPFAVVCLANKTMMTYDITSQPLELECIQSQLKNQIRCVSIFPDKKLMNRPPQGFAIGCTDGRGAVHFNNKLTRKDNFTFKGHQPLTSSNISTIRDVYPLNDISFHPSNGTMVTGGSDGMYTFYNLESRTRLRFSQQMDQPITSCCFSSHGDVFAYSLSYDWSMGHEYNVKKKNDIFLYPCSPSDFRK